MPWACRAVSAQPHASDHSQWVLLHCASCVYPCGVTPLPCPAPQVVEGNDVSGVLCVAKPWPGIARTVHGDHGRYLSTYMQFKEGFYFTGAFHEWSWAIAVLQPSAFVCVSHCGACVW